MIKLTRGRIVAFLTPFVFVPAAAWATGLAARYLPFLPHFAAGQITAFEVTGATAALGVALHWLHNNAWWEKHGAGLLDITDTPS